MSGSRFMIYGAYGSTGDLIVRRAVRDGEAPILAGRRAEPLRKLAETFDLEWRAFGLDDPQEVARQLEDVALVLHCAGPFSRTSAPMVDACLASGTHYLDVTGEIDVFEAVLARDAEAQASGVVLMPGVGFDVVPTDCLAAALAAALPGATDLELAFWGRGGSMSPGTAKTMLENLPHGGRVRRAGKIEAVPLTYRVEAIDFPGGRRTAVAIAWGDVSTAFHTTGIPNVTCYTAVPNGQVVALRLLDPIRGAFGWGPVQRRLARWAEGHLAVPSEAAAERARTEVWGRARDGKGDVVTGTVIVREGYRFTVEASLCCAERVLAGEVAPGAWTPGKAFGPDLLLALTTFALDLPAPAEVPSDEQPALEAASASR